MENKVKIFIRIISGIWAIFTILYMTVLFAPSKYFVNVQDFQAIDTVVGEKMHFIAIRDAKRGGGGMVIEEVNISREDITEVVWRTQKEVLTEDGMERDGLCA